MRPVSAFPTHHAYQPVFIAVKLINCGFKCAAASFRPAHRVSFLSLPRFRSGHCPLSGNYRNLHYFYRFCKYQYKSAFGPCLFRTKCKSVQSFSIRGSPSVQYFLVAATWSFKSTGFPFSIRCAVSRIMPLISSG